MTSYSGRFGGIVVGVMGSADDTLPRELSQSVLEKVDSLGRLIAERRLILVTGATTGFPYLVGSAARAAGGLHVGISPASNRGEHADRYKLPIDACDLIIYTGFGLKGRNVVLVRTSDIVIFVSGSIGALNEFTIAYDEGKVIGCLTGTGGVADKAETILNLLPKKGYSKIIADTDPASLLSDCVEKLNSKNVPAVS